MFTWRAYELRCLETPGHSPGSMTYGLECGRQSLVFSGDVMLDGARMHTWFDSEWDYGFAKGLDTLITSVDRLVSEKPDILLPSHGPTVTDPTIQLADYAQKLRELQKRYVRGYPVFSLKDQQRDPLSRPTIVHEIFQVMPHLYKFNRPGGSKEDRIDAFVLAELCDNLDCIWQLDLLSRFPTETRLC